MFERTTITKLMNPSALVLGVLVAFVFALLLPDISYAQATSGIITGIGTGIENILWVFVNVLFGWLVWVGGMLLDTAINQYVIGFGTMYTGDSGLGFTIDRLWVIVRDIFNLTFIFGLVFIGLRMIFDSSNSSTRKMLINLILAALLVNFSLFITKFIIDFSNIAAAQIATAFQAGGTGTAQVSGHFMRLMGLTGLLNTGAGAGFNFANMTGGAGLGYILGTMILYIISAFVFLGGALLLMIRFAVLNIYMVLSPLMFIGWVFPSASGVTSKYWKGFLSRAFFAPAYLLMLYFAQSILSTFAITAQGASLSSIFTERGQATFSTVVPPFVLTAVFLIAALVVAQKMGANGADGVLAVGKTLTGKAKQYTKEKAGAATFGTAAAVGRTTFGQGASRLSQSAGLNKWAAKSMFGKAALGATRKVSDSSFDARQVGGLGKNLGIGTGRKGGYSTIVKERTKDDAEFAKSLKEGDISKDKDGKEYNDAGTKEFVKNYKDGHGDYQAKLADVTATAAAKSTAEAAVTTKLAEMAAEKARLEAEIAEADKSAIPAVKATAERKKQELAKYQSESKAELDKLEAVSKQASAAAAKAKEVEEKLLKTVVGQAEAMVKYANQLAFIETRENQANWRSKTPFRLGSTVTGNILGGGAAGLAGAGAAAGMAATGGAGILGYSILAGGTDIRNQSVEALRKTYGKDGTNMVKAKKEKEKMQTLQEVIKENAEPEEKKEDAE